MKRVGALACLALILAACRVGKAPAVSQKAPVGSLPKFRACSGEVVVEDTDFTGERNLLESSVTLSYSHTYLALHHSSDSLVRERIRKVAADLAGTLVKLSYPAIEISPDSMLRSKSYTEISYRTARILSPRISESNRQHLISELLTPSKSDGQVFIEIKSYLSGGRFRNILNVYVFDTKALMLLYYDHLVYHCDIRAKMAFSKVLNYAMGKLPPVNQ